MLLSNSRTLLEDILVAKANGYTAEFMYRDNALLCRENQKVYQSSDCFLAEYCIHENMSDPSEQSILFLIECDDQVKGILSSAYGIYANTDLIEFCMALKKM